MTTHTYKVTLNLYFYPFSDTIGDIEDHVKRIPPMEYVQYLLLDDLITDAKWVDQKFAIEVTVQSTSSEQKLMESLVRNPLEDGEYEASYDNGWTIKSPDGDEIGLVDYRRNRLNPITVVRLS